MPELPEVECARRLLEEHCVGAKVTMVTAMERGGGPRDGQFDNVVMGEGVTPEEVVQALQGRTLLHAGRKGKQLWLQLDGEGKHPLMHLGMTGNLSVQGVKAPKYKNFEVGSEWPLKFTKLELDFSNGVKLAYTDPRRLGRIYLRANPQEEPPISQLAPDPLIAAPSADDMAAALSRISAPIKAVLLDQQRIVSGVGNWVADEVCYQAGIHPSSPCNTLGTEQVNKLHEAVLMVVNVACAANAESDKYPRDWLFHYRWNKRNGKNGNQVTDAHGNPITFETVGGRTTAVVPKVMKMGTAAAAGGAAKPRAGKGKQAKKEGGGSGEALLEGKKPRGRKKAQEEKEPSAEDQSAEEQSMEEGFEKKNVAKRGRGLAAKGSGKAAKGAKGKRAAAGGQEGEGASAAAAAVQETVAAGGKRKRGTKSAAAAETAPAAGAAKHNRGGAASVEVQGGSSPAAPVKKSRSGARRPKAAAAAEATADPSVPASKKRAAAATAAKPAKRAARKRV